MLVVPSNSFPSGRSTSSLQGHGAPARCSHSPLFMQRRRSLFSHIRRPAVSACARMRVSKEKTNHHISTNARHSLPLVQNDVPFSRAYKAPFSPGSHGRLQSIAPQAFGEDGSGLGEMYSQRSGRGRGRGGHGGRGGGRTGRGGSGRGEQRNNQEPGRGTGRGGRASRGRGGFPDSGKSPEEMVPSLEVCILNAAAAAKLAPHSRAYCKYNLAKRVDMDAQRGAQYSSNECNEIMDAARKLIRLLLGGSSSPGAPGSNSQPPIQQLDSKHLSLLAWSLSVMGGFDKSLSAGAQQLCYAVAERAAQPTVMRARLDVACRNWAGVLYGLAKVGVKCSDDAHVKRVFYFCMEQDLPGLLLEGQKCEPQSVSNVAIACVDAEYGGSMQPFISAVAMRLGEPSMGGVGGRMMERAKPQEWSNLLYACAKLEQRGIRAGGGMGIITEVGAVAMAGALQKPVRDQPKPQELANTLWGLSYFEWYDASIITVLAHAVVERIDGSIPQNISNTLLALAKLEWYDEGAVSKLAAAMVECIGSSAPQAISNTLWALSTLGWYDPSVYDALLRALLDKSDQAVPQALRNAIYSCAVASHGGSAVDELAQEISRQDVGEGWKAQDVSNTLYAWAVLGSIGIVSDSLSTMAQHLMGEVNVRGPDAFQTLALRQLYLAHLEAEQVGLQGGGLSNGMLQAATEQHTQGQAELRKKEKQSGGTAGVQQAAAALQEAGYEVELGGWVGLQGDFFAELLVRHAGCGIAVDVLSGADVFCHPTGQLSGKVRQRHTQIRQRCDGLVVLSEGAVKQPGLVVQKVEEVMRGGTASV